MPKNSTIPLVIFGFLLMIPSFLSPEWTSLIIGIVLLLLAWVTATRWLILGVTALLPILLIPGIALLGSLSHKIEDVLKDGWYFLLPALSFLPGWILSRNVTEKQGWGVLRFIAFFSSLIYLGKIALIGPDLWERDVYSFRKIAGTVDPVVAWGVFLLFLPWLAQTKNFWNRPHEFHWLLLIPLLIAIGVSFSRTTVALLFMVFFGFLLPRFLGKWRAHYFAVLCIGTAALVLILAGIEGGQAAGESWVSRLSNSVWEVTGSDFQSLGDATQRYRAFETAMAFETYLEGNMPQLMFGQGLGAMVDLKWGLRLAELGNLDAEPMQFIPILHNGYLYLLLKSGITGLALYFFWMGRIWKTLARAANRLSVFGRQMGLGLVSSSLLATFVIAGPYNKGGWISTMLLLGWLCGHARATNENAFNTPVAGREGAL